MSRRILPLMFAAALVSAQDFSLFPPDPQDNGFFGSQLSVVDDRVVIAAFGQDAFKGKVYVYRPGMGSADLLQQIPNPDNDDFGGFGNALATIATDAGIFLFVGAPFNLVNGEQTGEVVAYFDAAGGPDQFVAQDRIELQGTIASGSEFGNAIDVQVLGQAPDQTFELAVGITRYFDTVPGRTTGAVAIFTSNDGLTWSFVELITGPDVADNAGFGGSVDLFGDRLAVGATNDTVGAIPTGAVYQFQRTTRGNGFSFTNRFVPEDVQMTSDDNLGHQVQYLDTSILAGSAPSFDGSGSVLFFDATTPDMEANEIDALFDPTPEQEQSFGQSFFFSEATQLFSVGSPGSMVDSTPNVGKIVNFLRKSGATFDFFSTTEPVSIEENLFFAEVIDSLPGMDSERVASGTPSRSTSDGHFTGGVDILDLDTPPQANVIFSDGFESGDTSAWTDNRFGGTGVVDRQSRFKGDFGYSVSSQVAGTFLSSGSPQSAPVYFARFRFRLAGLTDNLFDEITLFEARSTADGAEVSLVLVPDVVGYGVLLRVLEDSGNQVTSPILPVVDGWNDLEMGFAAGDGSGMAVLGLNGTRETAADLVNPAAVIDTVSLGVLTSVNAAIVPDDPRIWFDDFSSADGDALAAACLSLADLSNHGSDWPGKDILELAMLADLACP